MSLKLSTTAINDKIDDDIDDEIGPPRAMLLLSSYNDQRQPARLINTADELATSLNFNDNKVHGSCAVTHENKQYIFGGTDKANRQILQVSKCELVSIGGLPFGLENGGCSSSNGTIFLCFDSWTGNQCHSAMSPLGKYERMPNSNYYHVFTSIATSNGNNLNFKFFSVYFSRCQTNSWRSAPVKSINTTHMRSCTTLTLING